MAREGTIVSLNRSNGGVPKLPVAQAWASVNGMEGDRQRDRRFHGGPERALSLYSLELLQQLQLEGHPIAPGAAGENVTIGGIDWTLMRSGALLTLGEVEVELTTFAAPCKTIRRAFVSEDFTRISNKLHPGWSRVYSRVLKEGLLHVGARVTLSAP
jgi:MOSC domain-containing protein YiiM